MGEFTDVLQMLVVFGFFGFAIKAILDYSMRKKLIDKGLIDSNVKHLFRYGGPTATSLKWGMVLIGIGTAVVVGRFMPYRIQDEVTISMMFILAGLALVIYYFVAPKLDQNGKIDQPNL